MSPIRDLLRNIGEEKEGASPKKAAGQRASAEDADASALKVAEKALAQEEGDKEQDARARRAAKLDQITFMMEAQNEELACIRKSHGKEIDEIHYRHEALCRSLAEAGLLLHTYRAQATPTSTRRTRTPSYSQYDLSLAEHLRHVHPTLPSSTWKSPSAAPSPGGRGARALQRSSPAGDRLQSASTPTGRNGSGLRRSSSTGSLKPANSTMRRSSSPGSLTADFGTFKPQARR